MIWEKIKDLFSRSEPVEAVFKDEWIALLEENLPLYSRLPEDLRQPLYQRIARFISTTRFEGCNGLGLTDEMVLTVDTQHAS